MIRGNTDAETCRLNGWQVGTVLAGDNGKHPERIVITAIGEEQLLAKRISDEAGNPVHSLEHTWTLICRDWKQVES